MPPHHSRRDRSGAEVFDERHLVPLRPMRVSRRRKQECFIFPDLRDLVGTSFELCPDELRFLNRLLGSPDDQGLRRHNFWVYRSDQRKLAGDFVLVDVSRPPRKIGALRVPCWEIFIIDLKMHGELRLGGGGAGNQLMNGDKAAVVAQNLTARKLRLLPKNPVERQRWRAITRPMKVWRITGDRRAAIGFLCEGQP